jgi:hypothetical protein
MCGKIMDVIDNSVADDLSSMSFVWCKLRAYKYIMQMLGNGSDSMRVTNMSHDAVKFKTMCGLDLRRASVSMRRVYAGQAQSPLDYVDHAGNMRTPEQIERYLHVRKQFIDMAREQGGDHMEYTDSVHSLLSHACVLAEDQYYTCSTYKFVVTGKECTPNELYQSMWAPPCRAVSRPS